MSENISKLLKKANALSVSSGVYLMKDERGKIIYIGKAKSLKNRVTSYFRKNSNHDNKVKKMVSQVFDFDFIVTPSEFEALILESSLIKQYKPKYNILLKDDKGYSYIKISGEEYPKITAEYTNTDKKSNYIGPFTSSYAVKTAVDEVNSLFKLPTCAKKFPRDFGKNRACLNKHIKKCMGVCEGNIGKDEYNALIENAVDYLAGHSEKAVEKLKIMMQTASDNMEYEVAARCRDRIAAINGTSQKQIIIGNNNYNYDIIGLAQNSDLVSVAVVKYRHGKLVDKQNYFLGEWYSENMLLSDFIKSYYTGNNEIPPEIITLTDFDDSKLILELLSNLRGTKVKLTNPQKGEKLKLVMLAKANASEYIALKVGRTSKEITALEELAKLLGLNKTPKYIEAYDISNMGNSSIVSGMVVYENARPKKSDYKRFAIKGFIEQNDYASMQEVLRRRMTHYLNKDSGFDRLPDLVLLDGGKGHVSAVKAVFSELNIDVPLFGMVKDSKHKTRAITSDGSEISIIQNRQAFTFVSNIQEEVHRFAISYQRIKSKKTTFESELTKIEGIGIKRAQKLMKYYKTKKNLKAASSEEIRKVAGINEATANILQQYIDKNF